MHPLSSCQVVDSGARRSAGLDHHSRHEPASSSRSEGRLGAVAGEPGETRGHRSEWDRLIAADWGVEIVDLELSDIEAQLIAEVTRQACAHGSGGQR